MDLNGMFAFVQEPLSLRAASNIVLAAVLVLVCLASVWGYVHPLLVQPGWPTWTVPGFVLGVCIVAFAVATILIHAVIAAGAAGRGMTVRRAASREVEREAARQAAALEEARARGEERLAALLPSFPTDHRAILAQFAEGNAPHVLLNRADGYHGDTTTSALVDTGFLVYSAPVNPLQSLYALHPNAVRPVREYFDGVRRAETAKRREAIEAAVQESGQDARELLMLFGEPNPTSATEVPHPFLSHAAYRAVDPLVRVGVLQRPSDGAGPRRPATGRATSPSKVPMALTEEGKEAVERHVLGRAVARTRIDVHLDHVGGSGAAGSGATGSY